MNLTTPLHAPSGRGRMLVVLAAAVVVFVLIGAALFVVVLTSSSRGVPPQDALIAAAVGAVPAGLVAAGGAWASTTRRIWLLAVTGLLGVLYLWWVIAVAVPVNAEFYDSVNPGWNECQELPEGALCL